MKAFTRFLFALLTTITLTVSTRAQVSYGPILYQDDFSVSNSLWRFTLLDTHDNQAAIDASYGKIEGGILTLKANVGCGWDYIGSIASLQLPLPTNYVIEYRARKMQWCGSFRTDISPTAGTVGDSHFNPPAMEFGMAGNWFGQLCAWRTWDDQTCIPPATGTQINGQWYNYRIEKRGSTFKVYLNGSLQWAYSGPVLPGGFLHFGTGQAGSTAEVDDLKIYAIAPSLEIEVAAVRLKWLAELNVAYRVEWSSNLQTWSHLATVSGNGAITNFLDWTDGQKRFYRYQQIGELNLDNGLVAFYPFNGNANDESGNANHGIVNGATLTCDRSCNTSAYSFDGTNSFIELPPTSAFDSQDYTVSLWFNTPTYPDSFGPTHDAAMLISRGRNNFELHLGIGSFPFYNSGIRFLPRLLNPNTGQTFDAPSANFQTQVWTHLVAVYRGADNTARLFLNGMELALNHYSGPDGADDSHPARLGMRYDGSSPYKGAIDSVRIYNRALSEDEIRALFRLQD